MDADLPSEERKFTRPIPNHERRSAFRHGIVGRNSGASAEQPSELCALEQGEEWRDIDGKRSRNRTNLVGFSEVVPKRD